MTTALLNSFKQKIQQLTLIPGGGGCFEVSLDGDLVYSKLATGVFPEEGDIAKAVSKRLKKPT